MTPTATLCDDVLMKLLFMLKMSKMLVLLKMIVNDSNRNTVSPSLAVRPRLSQDQQRRGLSVVSTLEVNLEHASSPSTFLSLSSELMLTSLSPPPSDEVPGRHDPQCCLFSCW